MRHDPLNPTTAIAAAGAPTAPASATPAASATPGGLRKVSLGGIAKKKDDTSNKYPVYPDEDGKAAEIAARIAERQEQVDALSSALKT